MLLQIKHFMSMTVAPGSLRLLQRATPRTTFLDILMGSLSADYSRDKGGFVFSVKGILATN